MEAANLSKEKDGKVVGSAYVTELSYRKLLGVPLGTPPIPLISPYFAIPLN